jgi:diguanylate cyclase (GGDEF)-like protein
VSIQIVSQKDVLRYTARRAAITVSVTVAACWTLTSLQFGTDPNATVRVGFVIASMMVIGAIVAALLTGVLSYRAALMMQELTLTRAELQQMSRTDQLTGLLNRRGFDEAATLALATARRANLPVVALMCDIDSFKSINDRFGHEFGDRVLIEISGALRAFARDTDIVVARHGGEEFAALMIGVDNEQAMKYAEALRQACARQVANEAASVQVTVSIGIASSDGGTETGLAAMMRFADQALYTAKHRGRNRVARADVLIAA